MSMTDKHGKPIQHLPAYYPPTPRMPIPTWKIVLLICMLGVSPIAATMAGRATPGTPEMMLLVAGGVGLISGIVISLLAYRWTRSPWGERT